VTVALLQAEAKPQHGAQNFTGWLSSRGLRIVFADIAISDQLINKYNTGTRGSMITQGQVHQLISNSDHNFSLKKVNIQSL